MKKMALIIALLGLVLLIIVATFYYLSEFKIGEQTASVSGQITRINRDCEPSEYLAPDGSVATDSEDIICDLGTSITVKGVSIQTGSGYVLEEDRFGVSLGDIKPGDEVVVVYQEEEDGYNTLNCETCSIKKK